MNCHYGVDGYDSKRLIMEQPRTVSLKSENKSVISTSNYLTNKTDICIKIFIKSVTILCIGIMWLMLGTSCDRMDITRSTYEDLHRAVRGDSTKIDDYSGLSFELDSDSLEEEMENVYFNASEWEEEKINADL